MNPTHSKVEAYGVRGLSSKPWRKTFRSWDDLERWCERHDAEVIATREIEENN